MYWIEGGYILSRATVSELWTHLVGGWEAARPQQSSCCRIAHIDVPVKQTNISHTNSWRNTFLLTTFIKQRILQEVDGVSLSFSVFWLSCGEHVRDSTCQWRGLELIVPKTLHSCILWNTIRTYSHILLTNASTVTVVTPINKVKWSRITHLYPLYVVYPVYPLKKNTHQCLNTKIQFK